MYTAYEAGAHAEKQTEFNAGSNVWLNFTAVNESYVSCEESYPALVTLKRDSDGETVSFYTNCNTDKKIYALYEETESVKLNDYMELTEGNYSVSVLLNPASDTRMTEAYYLNNLSLTQLFTMLKAKNVPTGEAVLQPDNYCRCRTNTENYGILVKKPLTAFEGLSMVLNPESNRYMEVDCESYTLSFVDESSFRLTFKDGYLDTLGTRTHRFRFMLAGKAFYCDITVSAPLA